MINVPRITKNDWPKTISDLSEAEQERYYEIRNTAYYNLIQVEFQLAYHAHISIRDINEMSVHERRTLMEYLKQQKDAEAQAMDKAAHK